MENFLSAKNIFNCSSPFAFSLHDFDDCFSYLVIFLFFFFFGGSFAPKIPCGCGKPFNRDKWSALAQEISHPSFGNPCASSGEMSTSDFFFGKKRDLS